jgi:hypothetical protein
MSSKPIHKEYGKLSAADLRLLLSMLDSLEKEEAELVQDILGSPAKRNKVFAEDATQFVWAGYYELSFPICLQKIMEQFGIADEMTAIYKSDDQVQALSAWVEKMKSDDEDDDDLTPGQWLQIVRFTWALSAVLLRNIQSLMVYGLYINDLVKIAREGKTGKRDQALLNAIRIDPSVVGCKTGMERISRAILMQDDKFLSKLNLAIKGKLGAKEQATYKKMRFVLQVLHESKAEQLSDHQLMVLFVKELNLYHAPASAEKNLGEFARNFKKKKSTI